MAITRQALSGTVRPTVSACLSPWGATPQMLGVHMITIDNLYHHILYGPKASKGLYKEFLHDHSSLLDLAGAYQKQQDTTVFMNSVTYFTSQSHDSSDSIISLMTRCVTRDLRCAMHHWRPIDTPGWLSPPRDSPPGGWNWALRRPRQGSRARPSSSMKTSNANFDSHDSETFTIFHDDSHIFTLFWVILDSVYFDK